MCVCVCVCVRACVPVCVGGGGGNLINMFSCCFSLFLCFIFYFILILFNQLANLVHKYSPIILRKIKNNIFLWAMA